MLTHRAGSLARPSACLLLDWGDTLMRERPFEGPMEAWPRVEVVPGAVATLGRLRSAMRIVLVTNAVDSDEAAVWRALARAGVNGLLDRVFCARSVGARKPSSGFYRTVLGRLGVGPDDAAGVGDGWESDVLGARSVGMPVVWLSGETERALPAGVERAATWSGVPAALGRLGFPRLAHARAAQ